MSRFARGKLTRKVQGQMSGYEQAYAEQLEADKLTGRIAQYRFESIKLRLADKPFLCSDGSIELIEVKGSWAAPNQDKSRVKIKVAAALFPEFVFVAVTKVAKKHGGGWLRELF